jgi:hypothetical protein
MYGPKCSSSPTAQSVPKFSFAASLWLPYHRAEINGVTDDSGFEVSMLSDLSGIYIHANNPNWYELVYA